MTDNYNHVGVSYTVKESRLGGNKSCTMLRDQILMYPISVTSNVRLSVLVTRVGSVAYMSALFFPVVVLET